MQLSPAYRVLDIGGIQVTYADTLLDTLAEGEIGIQFLRKIRGEDRCHPAHPGSRIAGSCGFRTGQPV
jgi:hypothetical protein